MATVDIGVLKNLERAWKDAFGTREMPPTAWRVWWVSLNTARTELFEDFAKAIAKANENGGCVIPLYTGCGRRNSAEGADLSAKAPGEILELFRAGYLSIAETIDALDGHVGYVSVELLNIERAISDDLREQNAKLREAAERLWCTACGTVTRDMRCDCNRWPGDTQREPHFVNYADAMQETAHEQAQQIAKLEALIAATPAVGGEDDYAFRFQYADGSAFQIYADGRAYIMAKDGSIRDKPKGVIINRIPLLIGYAAKPRQDRIEELEAHLAAPPAAPLRGRFGIEVSAHPDDGRLKLSIDGLDIVVAERGTAKYAVMLELKVRLATFASPPEQPAADPEMFRCNCPHEVRSGCSEPRCAHYTPPRAATTPFQPHENCNCLMCIAEKPAPAMGRP